MPSAAPVPGPDAAAFDCLVVKTYVDVSQAEIDEWFLLQAPILADGIAGSSAATWALISPGELRLVGPSNDDSITAANLVVSARKALQTIGEVLSREILATSFEFYQAVKFVPENLDLAMRKLSMPTSRRRRGHVEDRWLSWHAAERPASSSDVASLETAMLRSTEVLRALDNCNTHKPIKMLATVQTHYQIWS